MAKSQQAAYHASHLVETCYLGAHVWCPLDGNTLPILFFTMQYCDNLLIDFFTEISLQYPLNGQIGVNTIEQWWGNTVFTRTGDWNNVVLKTVPPGQTFGWAIKPVTVSISWITSLGFFLHRPTKWWTIGCGTQTAIPSFNVFYSTRLYATSLCACGARTAVGKEWREGYVCG